MMTGKSYLCVDCKRPFLCTHPRMTRCRECQKKRTRLLQYGYSATRARLRREERKAKKNERNFGI